MYLQSELKNKIKAVFFDIDGTLIPHGEHDFPKSTYEALDKLKAKGIKVFICTGRAPSTVSIASRLYDFDGIVALNGQYVIYEGKVIRNHPIPLESLHQVIPYMEKEGIASMFAEEDYVYINQTSKQYKKFFQDKEGENNIDSTCRVETFATYQLMVFITEDDEEEFFQHLPNCKSARWHPDFADVIPSDGGKHKGIEAVCQHLGFTMEETMAFGDGGNDIDMLSHVGLGVAMGNAGDHVKPHAKFVTKDILDDGIECALKLFSIIEKTDNMSVFLL